MWVSEGKDGNVDVDYLEDMLKVRQATGNSVRFIFHMTHCHHLCMIPLDEKY